MKKLAFITTIALFAFVVTTGAPAALAKGNGNGKAFGHFIAPGWLKKNPMPSLDGIALPPGIAKKLGLDEGDDDDDTPEDTTAPVISNIITTDTATTAIITWDTDEPAKSTVHVSETSPVDPNHPDTMHVSDNDLTTDHEASFDGLTPTTTYYALIVVTDEAGNTATSSELSFTTDETPDIEGPIISDLVTVVDVPTTTITWKTNEPATSTLYFATSTGFGLSDAGVTSVLNDTATTSHSVSLDGLAATTTYYVRIGVTDDSMNTTLGDEFDFTTS